MVKRAHPRGRNSPAPAAVDDTTPTAGAARSQPRPWLHAAVETYDGSPQLLRLNADVLEVIAEYACGTVRDACALRGSCKGYRRAVDTTVRRLVYEDQRDLLRPAGNATSGGRASLRMHSTGHLLDAVCIAFTCDAFSHIAKLVVVAFALDGAKDEAHEGAVCGPRCVCSANAPMPNTDGDEEVLLAPGMFRSCWTTQLPLQVALLPNNEQLRRRGPEASLVACLSTVHVTSDGLTEELCVALEQWPEVWGHVTSFRYESVSAGTRAAAAPSAGRRVARLIAVLASQLTVLMLDAVTSVMCTAIAKCTKLVRVHAAGKVGAAASSALAKAIISSKAPLVSIHADMAATEAMRLLTSVATLRFAQLHKLDVAAVPPAVADRLASLNWRSGQPHIPRAVTINMSAAVGLRPSAHATSLSTSLEESLSIGDLGLAFPRLRRITIHRLAAASEINSMRFPASLESLGFREAQRGGGGSSDADEADGIERVRALVQRIGSGLGPSQLPQLAELHLDTTPRGAYVSLAPIVAFAATLTSLSLNAPAGFVAPRLSGAEAADLGGTLAHLTQLERVQIPCLPHGRCFLEGHHKRLRDLRLKCSHAPAAGAPFHALARACPRLVIATCECRGDSAALEGGQPSGWRVLSSVAFNRVILHRLPFHEQDFAHLVL